MTDDLEALFAASPSEEPVTINPDTDTHTPSGQPIVRLILEIEGTRYGKVFLLDAGFPTRYANEKVAILNHASQIGAMAANAFIGHWEGQE